MPSAKRIAFDSIDVSLLPLPSSGEHLIKDRDSPSLALRLRATGARTWVCLEKVEGRTKKRTLGNALLIPAAVARLMVDRSPEGIPDNETSEAVLVPETTVADLMARFLAVGANGRWKQGTVINMTSASRHAILPELGQSRVKDVTRQQVAAWYLDISTRTKGARMALSTLSGLMLYAEDHGLRPVGTNPCRGLRKKERSRRTALLSPSIVQALFRALDALQSQMPDVCDAVRLLLFTGARRSEILGLEWDRIAINRAVLEDSKTGPRVIWLNAPARQILDGRREHYTSPFVFPAPRRDGPIRVIDHGWRAICKEAGITSLRVHDLRHHFASLAVSHGVDLRVVGQLLGHRDIDSTLGYAHLASAALLKSASRVSAFIDKAMDRKRSRPHPAEGSRHA